MNAAGIQSEVVAVYPGNLDIDACGLSTIKNLAVKATVAGKDKYLSAVSLAPSALTARGELDQVLTLNGTSMAYRQSLRSSRRINEAQNGFAICTLPAITGGIEAGA